MNCQRCKRETREFTCSMFNTQSICMVCQHLEQQRPDYQLARDADEAAVKAGNYNFEGIGLRPLCEDCGKPIPAGDIKAFQGSEVCDYDGEMPRICEDCAEAIPKPDFCRDGSQWLDDEDECTQCETGIVHRYKDRPGVLVCDNCDHIFFDEHSEELEPDPVEYFAAVNVKMGSKGRTTLSKLHRDPSCRELTRSPHPKARVSGSITGIVPKCKLCVEGQRVHGGGCPQCNDGILLAQSTGQIPVTLTCDECGWTTKGEL